MIADLRLTIVDWLRKETRKSKTEIRNSGAGGGIPSFDFPVSSFGLCESAENRQLARTGSCRDGLAQNGESRQLRREDSGSRSIDNQQSEIGN
jgi:hypothetical protein